LAFINLLIRLGLARKVLIIAPLRVIYSVWPAECKKWNQFQNLKCSLVHGSEGKRLVALNKEADLYLINPEGVPWLANHYSTRPMPFDVLVVDESSKFKSWSSNRTKSLRKVLPQFKFRLILTGTPSPNSLEDLFAQIFIVDRGDSLGTSITEFRTRYFYRGGYGGYQWAANKGAQQSIEDRIKHACMRLASKDHLSLPDLMINDIWIDLPPSVARLYTKLEREMFVELDSHGELIANGAGAKYLMCKQLASGGLYDGDKNAVHVHESKIDALTDLVEELQGKPALLSFQFRHDLMRLQRRLPKLPSIDGTTKPKEADRLIGRWNAGELKHLAVQPQSLSHGINMQAGPGRDIIWLGLTDSLETYLQLNARIHRQGVTDTVRVHRILANRTVDQAVADRLDRKDRSQTALLDALGRYRDVLRQT
jgi:SNF2 family DNA or RNA helicase